MRNRSDGSPYVNAVATKAPRSHRLWAVSLGAAGFIDCSLALYHSILPYQMGWRQGIAGMPQSLSWALFALNFSWSVIVFLVGCLVIYAATLTPAAGKFAKITVFAVGLFWVIHGTYTWLNPFPMPRALWWLSLALGAFPVLAVIFHWLPLVLYRERSA